MRDIILKIKRSRLTTLMRNCQVPRQDCIELLKLYDDCPSINYTIVYDIILDKYGR